MHSNSITNRSIIPSASIFYIPEKSLSYSSKSNTIRIPPSLPNRKNLLLTLSPSLFIYLIPHLFLSAFIIRPSLSCSFNSRWTQARPRTHPRSIPIHPSFELNSRISIHTHVFKLTPSPHPSCITLWRLSQVTLESPPPPSPQPSHNGVAFYRWIGFVFFFFFFFGFV